MSGAMSAATAAAASALRGAAGVTVGVTNAAAATLRVAAGMDNAAAEEEVVRVGAAWWKRAMEGGWVSFFAAMTLSEDMIFDDFSRLRPRRLTSRDQYLSFYNGLLDMHAPHRMQIAMDWGQPRSQSPGIVHISLLMEMDWTSGHQYQVSGKMEFGLSGTTITIVRWWPAKLGDRPPAAAPPVATETGDTGTCAEDYAQYLIAAPPSAAALSGWGVEDAPPAPDPGGGGDRGDAEWAGGLLARWGDASTDEEWAETFLERYLADDVMTTDHTPAPTSILLRGKADCWAYYRAILRLLPTPEWRTTHREWRTTSISPGPGADEWSARCDVVWEFAPPEEAEGEDPAPRERYEIGLLATFAIRGAQLKNIVVQPAELCAAEEGRAPAQRGVARECREMDMQSGWMPDLGMWRQWRRGGVGQHICRPCGHNDWALRRVKRGWVTLRCRVGGCAAQWRQRPSAARRCPAHDAARAGGPACPAGAACELLHVYSPPTRRVAGTASPPRGAHADPASCGGGGGDGDDGAAA